MDAERLDDRLPAVHPAEDTPPPGLAWPAAQGPARAAVTRRSTASTTELRSVDLDDVAGAVGDRVAHRAGRQGLVAGDLGCPDALVGRQVEARLAPGGSDDLDRQPAEVGLGQLRERTIAVQPLRTGHEVPEAVLAVAILVRVRAEQGDHVGREQVGLEAVDEGKADDALAIGRRHHPGDVGPERVADEHERAVLAGGGQQGPEVGRGRCEVGGGAVVAAPDARSVVGAGPRRRRQLGQHRRPRLGARAHAGHEHDRRRAAAPAIEVERTPAQVHPLPQRLIGRGRQRAQAVAREPGARSPRAADVHRQGDGQADDDSEPGEQRAGDPARSRPRRSRPRVASRVHPSYRTPMCRSIKQLRRPDTTTTTGEVEAAARQFVRKLSGYRTPSARNSETFDAAIAEVSAASMRLLEALGVAVEEGPDRWVAGAGRART